MRGGKGAIGAGFFVAGILITYFIFALGRIDSKYMALQWPLAFAIFQTIPIILVLGVKKGIINFMAFLVITLVMESILLVITLVIALIGT